MPARVGGQQHDVGRAGNGAQILLVLLLVVGDHLADADQRRRPVELGGALARGVLQAAQRRRGRAPGTATDRSDGGSAPSAPARTARRASRPAPGGARRPCWCAGCGWRRRCSSRVCSPIMKIRAAVLEQFGSPLERPGDRPRRAEAPARCSSDWSPAASATPTSTPPPAPTRRATPRPCSGTRARAWSRRSARASPRWRPATTSSPSSRRSAASASTVRARARTCAWRSATCRTRATCPTAPPASPATASRSATSWGRAPSRSTP